MLLLAANSDDGEDILDGAVARTVRFGRRPDGSSIALQGWWCCLGQSDGRSR